MYANRFSQGDAFKHILEWEILGKFIWNVQMQSAQNNILEYQDRYWDVGVFKFIWNSRSCLQNDIQSKIFSENLTSRLNNKNNKKISCI